MPFNRKYLSKKTQDFSGPLKPWVYDARASAGNDTIANINTDGYMNDAWNDFTVGDKVEVIDNTGAVAVLLVNKNDRNAALGTGSVDLTDGSVVTATDGD